MTTDRDIALSNAQEHLVYAYVGNDVQGIKNAYAEIETAKNMDTEPASDEVKAILIRNSPLDAYIAGLVTLEGVHDALKPDPSQYLTSAEFEAYGDDPDALLKIAEERRKLFGSSDNV